jgi:ubiquinone/menaquinone biosynthesis C-methylase UbiE
MTEDTGGYDIEILKEYEEDYFNYVKDVRGVDFTYYGNWQRDFGKLIIDLADLESDPGKEWHTILDIGCATALNLRAIDELGIFSQLYGTDRSHYMINMIPNLHDFGSDAKFIATPSHNLEDISDGEVDLIMSTHVFEHLESEERLKETLEEMQRVLHPDGKILIIVPTKTKDYDPSEAAVHVLNEGALWWTKIFGKYFKSETSDARKKFKATKLKPNRKQKDNFYDTYNHVWTVYRLIHKK